MKEMRIPLEKFDLDGFVSGIMIFLKSRTLEGSDPSPLICWAESPGAELQFVDENGWDFRSKLLNEPDYLFFPFAHPDLRGSFDCADGQSYRVRVNHLWGEDGKCADLEKREESDEPVLVEVIFGYLVRLDGGEVEVILADFPLMGFTVNPICDGHFLEQQMVDFINRFIK
jgi:hypothetical protein